MEILPINYWLCFDLDAFGPLQLHSAGSNELLITGFVVKKITDADNKTNKGNTRIYLFFIISYFKS